MTGRVEYCRDDYEEDNEGRYKRIDENYYIELQSLTIGNFNIQKYLPWWAGKIIKALILTWHSGM